MFKKFVQKKFVRIFRSLYRALGSPYGAIGYRALGSPYGAIGPPHRPLVPLTGALFSCLIVGHSPGLNCIGPRGGSQSMGLGRT